MHPEAGAHWRSASEDLGSEVFGLKASVFADAREHAWPYLFAVMEREDIVAPADAGQHAM